MDRLRMKGRRPGSRTPKPHAALLRAWAVGLVLAGCNSNSSGIEDWGVITETLPNGVVRVVNSPPVTGIEPLWTLRPELRIGSAEGSGPEVFGMIKGIAAVGGGGIAVLDVQAQEMVRVFESDGKYSRSMGRRGAGPGELNDPNGMMLGPDGLLRVNDPRNARLSFFHPDSGFVRSQQIEVYSYGWLWNAVVDSLGRTIEPTLAVLPDGRWNVIRVLDAFGTWTDTIRLMVDEPSSPTQDTPGTYVIQLENGWRYLSVPYWPRGGTALDPQGYFWVKQPHVNDYRIAQVNFARDTVLELESRRSPLPVSRLERDSVIALIRESAPSTELDWSQIPSHKPVVQGLFLDDAGRVWVQVRAAEEGTTYDIFSREGVYQGTVATDMRVMLVPVPIVAGGLFYGVVTDEFDIQHVVRARIE